MEGYGREGGAYVRDGVGVGVGVRAQGLGFRIPGSGFRNFGALVSGFVIRDPEFTDLGNLLRGNLLWLSGFGFQVPGFGVLVERYSGQSI